MLPEDDRLTTWFLGFGGSYSCNYRTAVPRSVTRHLFPSFFNCTPAETDVGTRLAGPARCGDLFVRARRAGCHRSGRATAAVRWPRCASLLRYARFARRILCPAGFLVALVFSRSKNASSNSSLLQAGAHVRSGGLQAASRFPWAPI